MKEVVTDKFADAVRDYSSLLNKGYPEKRILDLVGDHYSLSRHQRILLYRGLSDRQTAAERRKKLTGSIRKKEISIDTYNVLLTVANYLYGRVVFLGNDGFLRDAGEVFGSILQDDIFYKGVDLFFGFLHENRVIKCTLYIDSPVSYSGRFAEELRARLKETGIEGSAETVRSPDYRLKKETGTVICTSDSAVIDAAVSPLFDLARAILDENFKPGYIDLREYL